jgi:uncharacterized membrane protein
LADNWRWRKYRSAEYCARLDAERVAGAWRNQEEFVARSISVAEQVVRPSRIDIRSLDLDDRRSRLLISVGRWFFGLALLGLGAEHFVYREIVIGRAPAWPDGVPGMLLWTYGFGVLVMLVGVAVLFRRWARPATLVLGMLVFGWALLRHLPIVIADSALAGSWTSAGKALVFFGGSFAIAATFPPLPTATPGGWRRFANATDPFVRMGQYSLASFLILCGMQHFKYLAFVATLIPAWFPGNAVLWSQFAGIALLTFGVGLLFSRTAALAALLTGLMIFSWFWIVHLPRVHTSVSDGIAVFEALAFSGLALALSGALAERRRIGAQLDSEPTPIVNRHEAGRSG